MAAVVRVVAEPAVDRTLLAAIATGDLSAFATFYDRHATVAYSLALRLSSSPDLAGQLVEAAFLNLWRARELTMTFRNARTTLELLIGGAWAAIDEPATQRPMALGHEVAGPRRRGTSQPTVTFVAETPISPVASS